MGKLLTLVLTFALGLYFVLSLLTANGPSVRLSTATTQRQSDATSAPAISSRFIALPAAAGHTGGIVYVVAAQNCSREEARRADQLVTSLRHQGVRVERVHNVSFPKVDPSQFAVISKVMEGALPIVFLGGAAVNNPSLDEVLDQLRRR